MASQERLSNEDFLSRISTLLSSQSGASHGSIYLTQKRLSYEQTTSSTAQFPDIAVDEPLPILIRATNGKSKDKRKSKVKVSTVVKPDDLEAFYAKYAEVARAGMTALKKRDRSKRKKTKKTDGKEALKK